MTNRFSVTHLKEYTKEKKLPFIVHWNITENCNLRCTHCCVKKNPTYVSLEEARGIIDFLKSNNFFLVTLSGGECTLHPNFEEIYMLLKDAGMYINIFTNGTLFTPRIKKLLSTYKPRKVEVSVYGIDEKDFEKTTLSKNGYSQFLDTLDFLKKWKIRTVIKAPITKKNYMNLQQYIELAKRYNAEYKFGTFVFPALDGDHKPLEERLDYNEAVNIEFSEHKAMMGYANRVNEKGKIAEPFYNKCSACTNSFTINADNSFSFCGMMVEPKFSFDNNNILDRFNEAIAYRSNVIKMYEDGPCKKCEWANACPGCPAHLLLETRRVDKCNEYFYNITKCKLEYLDGAGLLKDKSILENSAYGN